MTNKEIYKLLDKLGMIDNDNNVRCADEPIKDDTTIFEIKDAATIFEEDICTDLVSTMKFVDELMLNNGEDAINKFLVALFTYNNGEKNDTRN